MLTAVHSASPIAKISWICTYISPAMRYGIVVLISVKPATGKYKFFKTLEANSMF